MARITFIGTGYVGLVSGTCLASLGHHVTCVDKDEKKIAALRDHGKIPIYEPGLDKLVVENVKAGRLDFSTSLAECVPESDAVFIAVGTPQSDSGQANLDYIFTAAEEVAAYLSGYTVVVTKSTVPVGTNQKIEDTIARVTGSTENFDVASNPEFLREGKAIDDFSKPDRIVVGVKTDKAKKLMENIYKKQTDQGFPIQFVSLATAEVIKYASNAFLATKITFMNEMAALCESVDANIDDVADGMGVDQRIGRAFLNAGPGYGGSCFPKDTHALAFTARQVGEPLSLVEATIKANQNVKERMVEKIIDACDGSVQGKTIGVLGLAFKANTDDMRDAPCLTILPKLKERGAIIQAHDPQAAKNALALMPDIFIAHDTYQEAAKNADALLIMTEWSEYKKMDLSSLEESMNGNTIIDLRNILKSKAVTKAGLSYFSIGKPPFRIRTYRRAKRLLKRCTKSRRAQ